MIGMLYLYAVLCFKFQPYVCIFIYFVNNVYNIFMYFSMYSCMYVFCFCIFIYVFICVFVSKYSKLHRLVAELSLLAHFTPNTPRWGLLELVFELTTLLPTLHSPVGRGRSFFSQLQHWLQCYRIQGREYV